MVRHRHPAAPAMENTMAADTHGSTISTLQAEVDSLILDLYPQQGDWTEEQYLRLTDHVTRLVEFTDGYIEVLPMPTDNHQSILLEFIEIYDRLVARSRCTRMERRPNATLSRYS